MKLLRPLAKINDFIKDAVIQDIKWVLNDTFLVIVTSRHEIIIFDVLL